MSIETIYTPVSYNGDGVTNTFPFTFDIDADSEIVVTETTISNGDQTVKTLTTHYTVVGFNVIAVTAPSSSVRWTIGRSTSLTQGVDLVENDSLPAETVEGALDKGIKIAQEQAAKHLRTLRQPDGDTANIGDLPSKVERALKYLGCDANGDPISLDVPTDTSLTTAYTQTLLDDANAPAARLTLGFPDIAAKGDLIVGSADDTLVKLAVGADGTVPIGLAAATPGLYYQPGVIGQYALIGGHVTVSMAANAVTLAIKTTVGNNPSSTEPVWVAFRSATLTDPIPVWRKITAATSVVLSSGSTLGTVSGTPSRVYFGLIDNAGTVELCVWNPISGTSLYGPQETVLQSTTAEGGAGGANSAQVLYSTTARASKAFRVAGYFESTQATAGIWASAATIIQLMGPGVKRTGDIVQRLYTRSSAVATGTTVLPIDDTIPQNTEGDQYLSQTITPVSLTNLLLIEIVANLAVATNVEASMALFQDLNANALAAVQTSVNTINQNWALPYRLEHTLLAGTLNSTTFKLRAGPSVAGTMTFNGSAGARLFGGVISSSIHVTEIVT